MVNGKLVACALIAVAVIAVATISSVVSVDVGTVGLIKTYGALDTSRVLQPGLNFITPFAQSVIVVPVAHQIVTSNESASSHDLQDVTAGIAVEYNIDPPHAATLYSTYLGDQNTVLILPAIHDTVKAITANYTAEQLVTEREKVKTDINNALQAKLAPHGILLSQTSITDFAFSSAFYDSIEQKVVAQQNAEQALNVLRQKQIEAEYTVAAANGTAEAIKIQSEALRENPEYLKLMALQKWDGVLPKVLGAGAQPFVNLNDLANTGTQSNP